jgi:hypothetical protein
LYFNSHSFELLLFFLLPFSHLQFFTCRHMPEIFVILKFIVAIFGFVSISFFLLLSTLYISINLYTLLFIPLLYEMLLHFTFFKNACQFLLLRPFSFLDTYIYMCMYVYIPHFHIPLFQKWTFFFFELFRIRKNWRTGEIRNKFHAKLRKHNNMYVKLKRTPETNKK